MNKLKVAVLMGGTSAEREVSLWTGEQILNALSPARYTVYALDSATGRNDLPAVSAGLSPMLMTDGKTTVSTLFELPQVREQDRPDIVVIALHGPGGEDGTVQGMLEVLGIPYTGSGVLASALAMDKAMTKRVLRSAGVLMPGDVTVKRGETVDLRELSVGPPCIVKPNRQGSTIGMTKVTAAEQLGSAIELAFGYDDTVLIEQFVAGTEITVPIVGNRDLEVLPIVEIVPKSGFFDYKAKYTAGETDEIVPARIDPNVAENARKIAVLCHQTLGCRGMSRTDMIVAPSGDVYTLELNTIPGMAPTSLLPLSARAAGITFSALMDRLIELALERDGIV